MVIIYFKKDFKMEGQGSFHVAVIVFGKTSSSKIINLLKKYGIEHTALYPDEYPMRLPTHIILSGGPKHVYEKDHYPIPEWVMMNNIPVLGICYGMQLIAHTFGGLVKKMKNEEIGGYLVAEIIEGEVVISNRWMYRYDEVVKLPDKFTITGITSKYGLASFTDNIKWWAVQYHPESDFYGDEKIILMFLCRQQKMRN